jgi:para-aminobenzoate synthetase component 1
VKLPRSIFKLSADDVSLEKILSWGKQFDPFVLLNSNTSGQLQKDKYSSFDLLVAAGKAETIKPGDDVFSSLKNFHSESQDWIFGFLSYDIKNQVENLNSNNYDGINAPECHLFCPRYVLEFNEGELKIHYRQDLDDESTLASLVNDLKNQKVENHTSKRELNIKSRVSREEYIDKINRIKKHIHRGDIYEMNYCMEFYAENAEINPVEVYSELNKISPMPFSAFYRANNQFLMCASPERFLAKRGNKIISQPIKGTAKRGKTEEEDIKIIESFRNDPKEQSENVMIVDLVRNDLSRTASRGSVVVEELFGVKSFRLLHQLVSTVTSELKKDTHFTEAIKKSFPMGSMTGAPKIKAMEIIEEYESTKRGIFSGTVGYITPSGDFDFNVVIRSILYNSENRYLSFMAGSAITASSVAEKEYVECMLKAEAMKKVLGDN